MTGRVTRSGRYATPDNSTSQSDSSSPAKSRSRSPARVKKIVAAAIPAAQDVVSARAAPPPYTPYAPLENSKLPLYKRELEKRSSGSDVNKTLLAVTVLASCLAVFVATKVMGDHALKQCEAACGEVKRLAGRTIESTERCGNGTAVAITAQAVCQQVQGNLTIAGEVITGLRGNLSQCITALKEDGAENEELKARDYCWRTQTRSLAKLDIEARDAAVRDCARNVMRSKHSGKR